MLKKIIFLFLLISIPSIAIAYHHPQVYGLTQAYIGAGISLSNNVPYNPKAWDGFGHPVNAELITGYGIDWTPYFYSAIEGLGTLANNRNYTWGVRIVPGVYFLSHLLGYATVGFVSGNNYPFIVKHPASNNGVQFGGGLQYIFENYSLRAGWYRNNFNVGQNSILSSVDQFYLTLVYHFVVSPGIQCQS